MNIPDFKRCQIDLLNQMIESNNHLSKLLKRSSKTRHLLDLPMILIEDRVKELAKLAGVELTFKGPLHAPIYSLVPLPDNVHCPIPGNDY